eukprot:763567-Hanusia_phi.AAC.2
MVRPVCAGAFPLKMFTAGNFTALQDKTAYARCGGSAAGMRVCRDGCIRANAGDDGAGIVGGSTGDIGI